MIVLLIEIKAQLIVVCFIHKLTWLFFGETEVTVNQISLALIWVELAKI